MPAASSSLLGLGRQVQLSLRRHSDASEPSSTLLSSFLADTTLDGCEPLVCRLPAGLFDGARGVDEPRTMVLDSFVDEVSALAADNPFLCTLARRMGAEALLRSEHDEEVCARVNLTFSHVPSLPHPCPQGIVRR